MSHTQPKPLWVILLSLIAIVAIAGCAVPPASAAVAQSDKPRDTQPAVAPADEDALAAGNTAFALDLYRQLKGGSGNLFYSPYSISLALAMTYAGANGDTAAEMARALHFDLDQAKLHPVFNALALELASRANDVKESDEGQAFQLNVANALWGQSGYPFREDFLDTLAVNYGAGMRLVDYEKDFEGARQTINAWVAEQTEQRIKDLIAQGALDSLTRLVLTNAIYFKASWDTPFDTANTRDMDFHLLDGSTVSVPMMAQGETFPYVKGDGYQAVALPYSGNNVSMLVLVPDEGQFAEFEAGLDAARLTEIVQSLQPTHVDLGLPKFTFSSEFELNQALSSLGMKLAFDPEGADFSGMDGKRDLFISAVVHKAFVGVDEAGTEAAAATAVIMKLTSLPSETAELTVDRPFIFLIRDEPTGTLLFAGRVLNPSVE